MDDSYTGKATVYVCYNGGHHREHFPEESTIYLICRRSKRAAPDLLGRAYLRKVGNVADARGLGEDALASFRGMKVLSI
jgi:hypothetical protein